MRLAIEFHLLTEHNSCQRQQNHARTKHHRNRGDRALWLRMRFRLKAVEAEDRPHGKDDNRAQNFTGEGHGSRIDPFAATAGIDFIDIRQKGVNGPGNVVDAAGAETEQHRDAKHQDGGQA